jgi:hypothetical protein
VNVSIADFVFCMAPHDPVEAAWHMFSPSETKGVFRNNILRTFSIHSDLIYSFRKEKSRATTADKRSPMLNKGGRGNGQKRQDEPSELHFVVCLEYSIREVELEVSFVSLPVR